MPKPAESLGYMRYYSSSSPRSVKSPCNSITTVRSSAVDQEDLKPYYKSEKKATLVKFFNDFTNHSKKTIKAVVFS